MSDPADDVLLLLPDRSPDRHIVKAAIQQPGDLFAGLEFRQCLTHRREHRLHLRRFTDEAGFLATQHFLVENTATLGRDTDHGEGAIARHEPFMFIEDLHQIRHFLGIRFTEIRAIADQPHFLLLALAQLLHSHLPQLGSQMLGVDLRAFGAFPFGHPQHPLPPILAPAQFWGR
jgi:hypothetical protein